MRQISVSGCGQRLGEDVSEVLGARHPGKVDHFLCNPVSNHVIFDVDVLSARVVDHVLGDAACSDHSEQFAEEVIEVQPLSAAIGDRDVLSFS